MILRKELKLRTLFFLGIAAMVSGGILRHFLAQRGPTSDAADFALGVLVGIGAGLLIVVAWFRGRR